MQSAFVGTGYSTIVLILASAALLGHSVEASLGESQSGSSSNSSSRKTSTPGEFTEIRILEEADFKKIEFLERYCFDEVNKERKLNGLAELTLFDDLAPVARRYSRRMAEEGFFSHADPDGLTLKFRLAEARIKSSERAENLSRVGGFLNPVPEVVRSWMKSPGHRQNILEGKYTHSAVGIWISSDELIYVTQIFIR
jgi:uncharacterized protein YkwD